MIKERWKYENLEAAEALLQLLNMSEQSVALWWQELKLIGFTQQRSNFLCHHFELNFQLRPTRLKVWHCGNFPLMNNYDDTMDRSGGEMREKLKLTDSWELERIHGVNDIHKGLKLEASRFWIVEHKGVFECCLDLGRPLLEYCTCGKIKQVSLNTKIPESTCYWWCGFLQLKVVGKGLTVKPRYNGSLGTYYINPL